MQPTISIIGVGALGQALALACYGQGYELKSLFNRTAEKAEALGRQLEVSNTGDYPTSTDQLGDLVFITVADDAIGKLTEKLSNELGDLTGKTVVHCSGNEASNILDSLQDKGANIAAFHPLQTFNLHSGPDVFQDIYISLEGDEQAMSQLEDLASRLGANTLQVSPEGKVYLHAAAVVASNYLITLMEISGDIAELGELNHQEVRRALNTLVQTTVKNSTAADLSRVLSGPIVRGDINTIKKHLELLEQNSRLQSLYKLLGLETVRLAEKRGTLKAEQLDRLLSLLSE